jgi:hypothetical protein
MSTAPGPVPGPASVPGSASAAPVNRRQPGTRLPLLGNPLRLAFSPSPWRGAWYLAGYVFVIGWVLCAVAFLAVGAAGLFAVTIAGLPLLAGAAWVLRGCANVERARLRQVFTEPVLGGYRTVAKAGLVAQATTRWRDQATWRDCAYLVGLWGPLAALDLAVLTIWLVFLAMITVPAWYWAVRNTSPIGYSNGAPAHGLVLGYFPHGPHGPGSWGFYIDTLPKALLLGAISLVLFLLFNYVLVATARAHANVARALLHAPADPLAEAKDVLARPGPIPPLWPAADSALSARAVSPGAVSPAARPPAGAA